MILSNTSLNGVRDQVRTSALESFTFFSNHVMGIDLSEDLCSCVEDVVGDQADFFFHTNRPKGLASALQAWLESRGVTVLSTFSQGEREILKWLGLQSEPTGLSVALQVLPQGVGVQWLP